jgi:hypothetical protein
MTERPTGGTAAGELQIGDRVTWLTGDRESETSKIVGVRDAAGFPGYVEVTGQRENGWEPHGGHLTRRFPKDRLVACVIAKTLDPAARIWSENGKAGLLMHAYPDPARSAACRANMPARKWAPDRRPSFLAAQEAAELHQLCPRCLAKLEHEKCRASADTASTTAASTEG